MKFQGVKGGVGVGGSGIFRDDRGLQHDALL